MQLSLVAASIATLMVAASASATSTTAVASTSASAAHHTCHFGQFFVGGRTVFYYLTYEVQVAACQGMVHVHGYDIFLHFDHATVDVLAFGRDKWNDGTFYHAFAVKLAIYLEDMFGQVYHVLVVIVTISVGTGNGEVELVALLQVFHLVFEFGQGSAQA